MEGAPGLLGQDELPLLHQLHQPLQRILDGLRPRSQNSHHLLSFRQSPCDDVFGIQSTCNRDISHAAILVCNILLSQQADRFCDSKVQGPGKASCRHMLMQQT